MNNNNNDLPPEKLSKRPANQNNDQPAGDDRPNLPPERSSRTRPDRQTTARSDPRSETSARREPARSDERSTSPTRSSSLPSRPQHQRVSSVTARRHPLQDRLRRSSFGEGEGDGPTIRTYSAQQMEAEREARIREEELHPGHHWYRMDLHCHTPRSTVCHQQPDVTYLQILQKAEERGVDILAITDHNTVAAYDDIQRERKDLERLERDGRATADERYRLSEYRRIFSKMLVLPGFEFSATFGFHILCIFPPSMSTRRLEHILMNLGITEEKMLLGSPEVGSTTDVINVYRTVAKEGGICIGAHANSSNGIMMRGLNFGGQTKIAFTQDPDLAALEVTDLDNPDRRSSGSFFNGSKPEYPRRMFCIQSSDSHRVYRDPDEKSHSLGVGDRTTEVLLPEQSFSAMKELFASNEFTRCRPSRPYTEAQVDVVQQARTMGANLVQAFHDRLPQRRMSAHHIVRDVIAFANTNGGTIFLGVDANPTLPVRGVDNPVEVIETLRSEIQRNVYPALKVSMDVRVSEGKSIVLVNVPKGAERPYAIDNTQIYIRQEAETSLAARDEIVQLVRDAVAEGGGTVATPLTNTGSTTTLPSPAAPTPGLPTTQPAPTTRQGRTPRPDFQPRRQQPTAAPTQLAVSSLPSISGPLANASSGQPTTASLPTAPALPTMPSVAASQPPATEQPSTGLRPRDRESRRQERAQFGAAYISPTSPLSRPAPAPFTPAPVNQPEAVVVQPDVASQPEVSSALAVAMQIVNEGDPQVAPAEAREEQAASGEGRGNRRRHRPARGIAADLPTEGEESLTQTDINQLVAAMAELAPADDVITMQPEAEIITASPADLPLDMSVDIVGHITPPRTGVEIVESVERESGPAHHTMRDLRNNNLVHNVSRHSARRLWRYAITQREHGEPTAEQIEWRQPLGETGGEIGIWRSTSRNGARRFDLAQRDADGNLHVYYGVTEEGLHGPWLEFLNVTPQPEAAEVEDEAEQTARPTFDGQLAPMEDDTPGLPEPFGEVVGSFASPSDEEIVRLFSDPFADEIEAAFAYQGAFSHPDLDLVADIIAAESGSAVIEETEDEYADDPAPLADAMYRADAALREMRQLDVADSPSPLAGEGRGEGADEGAAAVIAGIAQQAQTEPDEVDRPLAELPYEVTTEQAQGEAEAEAEVSPASRRSRARARARSRRELAAQLAGPGSDETIQLPPAAELTTLSQAVAEQPAAQPTTSKSRNRKIQPVELRLTPPDDVATPGAIGEQPAEEQPAKRSRARSRRPAAQAVSGAQAEQPAEQPVAEQPAPATKPTRSRSRKPAIKTSEEADEPEAVGTASKQSVTRSDLRRGRDENPGSPDNQPLVEYEDY